MWIFEQSTGKLYNSEYGCIATGYAGGNCGKNPEGKNNPDMQDMKCIGPLPVGVYKAGEPVGHSHLGPFAIPLLPDPANNMFGRGGFFMHGDTTPSGSASEGCVIMPRNIRDRFYGSADNRLKVVAVLDQE